MDKSQAAATSVWYSNGRRFYWSRILKKYSTSSRPSSGRSVQCTAFFAFVRPYRARIESGWMILASSCIIHSFNLQATFKNTGQCNDKQDNQAETALKVALKTDIIIINIITMKSRYAGSKTWKREAKLSQKCRYASKRTKLPDYTSLQIKHSPYTRPIELFFFLYFDRPQLPQVTLNDRERTFCHQE